MLPQSRLVTIAAVWSLWFGVCLALQPPHHGMLISRETLLTSFGKSALLPTILSLPPPILPKNNNDDGSQQQVTLPLTFLPRGGCLAVKIILNDKSGEKRVFSYYAIVDTGSPFLTAPPVVKKYSQDESRKYPTTQEQYGETIGTMEWRSLKNVEIPILLSGDDDYNKYVDNLLPTNVLVGLPEAKVVDDTGGIFLGLIQTDDYRPTFLRQWGYPSFILDYPGRQLILSKQPVAVMMNNESNNTPPTAAAATAAAALFQLFDFSPYGDNIHHYGVQCQSFVLEYNGLDEKTKKSATTTSTVMVSSLKRPVIAVIDSGLTGCIFSDSLQEELVASGYLHNSSNNDELSGLQATLPTISSSSSSSSLAVTLSSNPDYWFLSSFKLPWFKDDASHPHVIAMGATFLAQSRISIDPLQSIAKIEGPTVMVSTLSS